VSMDRAGAAPDRIDGAGSPTAEQRWVPALIVVALILLVVGGARGLAAVVTGGVGGPVRVGAAIEIQPRPGWDVEAISTAPPSARLHRGPVVLDVLAAAPDPAGPNALADRYVTEHLRPQLSQLVLATPDATSLADGVPAVRFGYVGVTSDGRAVEGLVVAASGVRASAIFDASAPNGELVTVADDLKTMIEGAVIG
jgi:hypothetical protein